MSGDIHPVRGQVQHDHARILFLLEREYRTADELMLLLANAAAADARSGPVWANLDARDRAVAGHASSRALRLSALWLNVNGSEMAAKLGWYAVAEAVAGEELSEVMPEVAANLSEGWRAARDVRARLRRLGPATEQVALRMVPSWRGDLRELPDAATAVACDG